MHMSSKSSENLNFNYTVLCTVFIALIDPQAFSHHIELDNFDRPLKSSHSLLWKRARDYLALQGHDAESISDRL